MDRRLAGALLLGAGALLWVVLHVALPHPASLHATAEAIRAEGPRDADEVRLVAWGGVVHSYNATRGQTLVIVAYCSHALCGPGVWLEGDLRGRLPGGPWILVPASGAPVGIERVEPPPRDVPPGPGGYRDADEAFTGTFVLRSVWPPLAAHLAAFALVLAGVAFLAPWLSQRQAGTVAAAGVVGVAAGSFARGSMSWALLLPFLLAVLAMATGALAALLGLALRRPRWLAGGLAVGLCAFGFLRAALVTVGYFPASGVGD